MIPVDQTIYFNPDPHSPRGNCFQAAIASMLELNLDDVPHFYGRSSPLIEVDSKPYIKLRMEQEDWIDEWLNDRNVIRHGYPWTKETDFSKYNINETELVIVSGLSARGINHATIGRVTGIGTWMIEHDPHFSRTGVVEPNWIEILRTL